MNHVQKLILLLCIQVGGHLTAQDIMISEIMSDPVPPVRLPEYEYVEIYAAEDRWVSGWTLTDAAGTRGRIDTFAIEAGHSILLCSREAAMAFTNLDPVVVEPWPVLNNLGDVLCLYDQWGQLVDSVHYSQKWHLTSNRAGGVSLERKFADYRCGNQRNWASSLHPDGGTPGKKNSVWKVGKAPVLLDYYSVDSVVLWFNVRLDPKSADGIQAFPAVEGFKPLIRGSIISILGDFTSTVEYRLFLEDIFTCSGDPFPNMEISFTPARLPRQGEILINEIYFNPPTGFVDYVELINTSSDALCVSGSRLRYESGADRSDEVTLDTLLSIEPGGIWVITRNTEMLLAQFEKAERNRILECENMINLPDDRATVQLFISGNEMIEEVYYDYLFHHDFLPEREGTSLERIDLRKLATESDNWISAANGGSPTLPNSQLATEKMPRVKVSPAKMHPGESTTLYYQNLPAGATASIRLFSLDGIMLTSFYESLLTGADGSLDLEIPELMPGLYFIHLEVLTLRGRTIRLLKKIYVGFP